MPGDDLRAQIRAEITAIAPFDAREAADQRAVLAWIDSGAPLCRVAKPATPPKHLVSYAVLRAGDRIALGAHRKSGLWLPSGGHLEPGESPPACACRELNEELGLTVTPRPPAALFVTQARTIGADQHEDVTLWYLFDVAPGTPLIPDPEEFSDMRWFVPEALPWAQSDPNLPRFLGKVQRL